MQVHWHTEVSPTKFFVKHACMHVVFMHVKIHSLSLRHFYYEPKEFNVSCNMI